MVRTMLNTLMLGAPWHDCVGLKFYPNFSLHMACVESMAHIPWKKSRIQRSGVWYLIASRWWCSCPSTQMKPLMISRHVGGRWWWWILITYNLVLPGKDTFGLIIANLVSKGSPFQIWHNLNLFVIDALPGWVKIL
jgi:hypothetical protein